MMPGAKSGVLVVDWVVLERPRTPCACAVKDGAELDDGGSRPSAAMAGEGVPGVEGMQPLYAWVPQHIYPPSRCGLSLPRGGQIGTHARSKRPTLAPFMFSHINTCWRSL